jgi:uncharacterized protein YjiS (DUF1127 family)
MTMTSLSFSPRDAVAGAQPRSPAAWFGRFAEIIRIWRFRAVSRAELARLGELDLKDIGYPARAAAEKAAPFWRE